MATEEKKEEKKEEKAKLPPLPEVKVGVRQFHIKGDETAEDSKGVLLSFDEVPISRGKDKDTGESKRGQVYLAPLNESVTNLVAAWGEKKVMEVFIQPRMKQLFQGLMAEATDAESGVFDEVDFIKLCNELSARGESIVELRERQLDLADQMAKYDFNNPEHIPILMRIAKQIKQTTEGIRNKKRKTKADKEAEAQAEAQVAA